ncbi:MAG TPA: CocE/NonD family hydrolase [Devosia sp.]|nr:CocE/NonD family hydrolase [Devosia sp.]
MRLLLRLFLLVVGLWLGLTFALRHRLGPATHRVTRGTGVPVEMPDGVRLMADLYRPEGPGPHPTLLMRLPYGRAGFAAVALAYARRGFNVVLQACRGTEDSEGEFNPLANERADGLATLDWLRRQPWFDGRLGLTGPSYLGFTQWAIADAPEVKAMAVKVSSAEFRSVVFPGGAFHLNLWLSWLQVIEGLRGIPLWFSIRMLTGDIERRTLKASLTLPLVEADVAAAGRQVPFWRDWFENALEDGPFWHAMDHRSRVGASPAPVHLMSGWYDFMLDQLLADYHRLVAAGRSPYLTISATTHIGGGHDVDNPAETLAWMRAFLMGDHSGLRRKPVAIEIPGIGWREFDAFPPGRPLRGERRYLLPDHSLSTAPALPAQPSRYRYDPADPTPNLGGAIFAFTGAGPVPQQRLEARPDVLVFTSAPLADPLTIIGHPRALIFMRASIPHADLFVRLCDVDRQGVSTNVCDGFLRTTPETPREADGIMALELKLHATAHCFQRGHRLRLQVSSGAHPRYARNMGTDESIGTATRLVAADIEIFHDNRHRSKLELPVYELG